MDAEWTNGWVESKLYKAIGLTSHDKQADSNITFTPAFFYRAGVNCANVNACRAVPCQPAQLNQPCQHGTVRHGTIMWTCVEL